MTLMIMYVFNYAFFYFVANYFGKVAIFPKSPSPQLVFHFGMFLKYYSYRRPLQFLYHLVLIFRRRYQQYIKMIFRIIRIFINKFMTPCNLLQTLLNTLSHICSNYSFLVLRSPYYGILRIVYKCKMCWSSYIHLQVRPFADNLKNIVLLPLQIEIYSHCFSANTLRVVR